MAPDLAALLKFAMPAFGIAVVLRRFGRGPLLAGSLKLPTVPRTVPWLLLYVGWMLATNAAIGWRGPWDFAPWRAAPLTASVLRVLAVVVAGPILEELVFRGMAWPALARSAVGPAVATMVTAIGWSLLHWSYEPVVIGVIMVAGVILGAARWRSGSVFLPIGMHMIWNAFAIW